MSKLKLIRYLPLVACGALLLMSGPTLQAGQVVQVILMAGQSNMEGHALAEFLPTNLQSPQTNVQFYNGDSSSATPSTLQYLKPDSIFGTDTDFGPEITFGQKIAADNPTNQYALLKFAVGGTSLATDWNATTPGADFTAFEATVTSGLQALTNAGYTPEIAGMLWLQGENDSAVPAQAAAYQQNLTNLISAVRGTYGANLPFIIGGIGYTSDPGRATVMAADAQLALTLPNVRYFSDDDINTNDELHFSTTEMETVGQRFATELESVQAAPEPKSVALICLGGASLWIFQRRKKSL